MLLMQRHSYNDGQIGNPEILRLRLSTAAAETFYGWLRLMNSTAAYGGGSGNFGGCNCWSRTIHNPAVRIVWRGWLKMFRGHSSRHVMQREWRRMTETPALLISVIFQSCIFQPFTFVHYIPVLHPPPTFHCPSFSCLVFSVLPIVGLWYCCDLCLGEKYNAEKIVSVGPPLRLLHRCCTMAVRRKGNHVVVPTNKEYVRGNILCKFTCTTAILGKFLHISQRSIFNSVTAYCSSGSKTIQLQVVHQLQWCEEINNVYWRCRGSSATKSTTTEPPRPSSADWYRCTHPAGTAHTGRSGPGPEPSQVRSCFCQILLQDENFFFFVDIATDCFRFTVPRFSEEYMVQWTI